MPVGVEDDELTDRRCDDRNDHENDHDVGHHPRHLATTEAVTHDRHGGDAHGGSADALDEAQDQQHFETLGQGGGKHRHGEEGKAAEQHGATSERIGKAAEEDLRKPEAKEEHADDELGVVGVGDAQRLADAR